MKAQFNDKTKTTVYLEVGTQRSIVDYDGAVELHTQLSTLIADKTKEDKIKKNIAEAKLAAEAKLSAPTTSAPKK